MNQGQILNELYLVVLSKPLSGMQQGTRAVGETELPMRATQRRIETRRVMEGQDADHCRVRGEDVL